VEPLVVRTRNLRTTMSTSSSKKREGFPMALIVEAAGGIASTGMFKGSIQRMLDLVPTDIHERCPVILGCPRDVNTVLGFYKSLDVA